MTINQPTSLFLHLGSILEECLLLSLTIFAPFASNSLTALFLSSSEVLFWKDTITCLSVFDYLLAVCFDIPSLPDAMTTVVIDSSPMSVSLAKLSMYLWCEL